MSRELRDERPRHPYRSFAQEFLICANGVHFSPNEGHLKKPALAGIPVATRVAIGSGRVWIDVVVENRER